MEYQIRKAVKEDMPQVLELIKELAVFEKDPDAVIVEVADLEREGFGDNPMFTCFVADTGNLVVGMALIYFRFSTWKGRTVHLEDLVVKESYRNHGIGKALYTEVMKYAREQGVKRVNWVVLDWNHGAIKFYERTGANILRDWFQAEMNEVELNKYLDQL